jgi:hypothetical protein
MSPAGDIAEANPGAMWIIRATLSLFIGSDLVRGERITGVR